MKKNYIIDTNVLLQDGNAILKFEDNYVYLPMVVIDELDGLKNSSDSEVAFNARRANRVLKETLKDYSGGKYIPLESGGRLYIVNDYDTSVLPKGLCPDKNDHLILSVAAKLQQKKKRPTVLVSKDTSLWVKAKIMGLMVEDYKNQQMTEIYSGRTALDVPDSVIDTFYREGMLLEDDLCQKESQKFYHNEFILMKSIDNPKKSALAVYSDEGIIKPLKMLEERMCGVNVQKVGQSFAKEALLTNIEEAPLAILHGPAGTAKTFLSMAAGLQMVFSKQVRQVLLLRPQSFFDADIGFLPGDEQSKIDPLLRPFYDNLALILELKGEKNVQQAISDLFEKGLVRAESFAYIRGRSITNSFIIIDEVQNASRGQIIGAITRAGSGSKIVLCGDIDQVDNPRLDSYSNGLSFAINRMKGSKYCYQVGFYNSECKRSPLAKDATERLIF